MPGAAARAAAGVLICPLGAGSGARVRLSVGTRVGVMLPIASAAAWADVIDLISPCVHLALRISPCQGPHPVDLVAKPCEQVGVLLLDGEASVRKSLASIMIDRDCFCIRGLEPRSRCWRILTWRSPRSCQRSRRGSERRCESVPRRHCANGKRPRDDEFGVIEGNCYVLSRVVSPVDAIGHVRWAARRRRRRTPAPPTGEPRRSPPRTGPGARQPRRMTARTSCRRPARYSSTLLPAPADPTTTVSRLPAPAFSRSSNADLVTSVVCSVVGRNFVSANRVLREASRPLGCKLRHQRSP